MNHERFLTVPSSGEAARPFEVLLDEASAALPADFPTSAGQVLVALDIDGTILTPAGATPRVLEGIHGLAAAGAHVLIASGRALEGVTPVLDALGFTDGWALCNNGATLVRVSGGTCEIVEERTFVPGSCLEEIASAVPGAVFASMPHPGILLSAPFPNNEIEGSDHRIVSMEELASTPTPKIVVRAADMDREEFDRILASLDVSRTHEVFVGWTSWADIEPLGVTKATGLESL
ncbi:HAD family hydrolase, partial [uncultured Actinomyces sp.]|uniref:HAD family hydrolase n=1 Tax=uncultured Actinomyces sp. TaxID=249061 RepID=UPI0028EA8A93